MSFAFFVYDCGVYYHSATPLIYLYHLTGKAANSEKITTYLGEGRGICISLSSSIAVCGRACAQKFKFGPT